MEKNVKMIGMFKLTEKQRLELSILNQTVNNFFVEKIEDQKTIVWLNSRLGGEINNVSILVSEELKVKKEEILDLLKINKITTDVIWVC